MLQSEREEHAKVECEFEDDERQNQPNSRETVRYLINLTNVTDYFSIDPIPCDTFE